MRLIKPSRPFNAPHTAYYNEIDPKKAQWLKALIEAGVITYGHIDTRSIIEVTPEFLAPYTQCHFFAGIGLWSYALRLAGWPDWKAVWTGSCPCQPFSAAGKRKGKADDRHLFPVWRPLISECEPDVVFGEQVASKDGLAWFDDVRTALEGAGYAVGCVDTCAAGHGSPHIRQRLYWVADSQYSERRPEYEEHADAHGRYGSGRGGDPGRVEHSTDARSLSGAYGGVYCGEEGARARDAEPERYGNAGWLAHGDIAGSQGWWQRERGRADQCATGTGGVAGRLDITDREQLRTGRHECVDGAAGTLQERDGKRERVWSDAGESSHLGGLEHFTSDGRIERRPESGQRGAESRCGTVRVENSMRTEWWQDQRQPGGYREASGRHQSSDWSGERIEAGPTNGFWRDADWVLTRPERVGGTPRLRPVEPGSFPLADGAPFRVLRLRGYGDGIVVPQAVEFIEAYREITQSTGAWRAA